MVPAALQHHRIAALSPAQIRALWVLWHRVFPNPHAILEQREARFLAAPVARDGEIFVVWDGGAPIATAAFFPREIRTAHGPLTVLALAGVCSAPERRGTGLGQRVTRAAFAEVDRGRFAVSLYQTGVPDFYAKLGARLVDNPFTNSRFDPSDPANLGRGTADQPWWNPHVMIYPATFDWPVGPIDLLGPGY